MGKLLLMVLLIIFPSINSQVQPEITSATTNNVQEESRVIFPEVKERTLEELNEYIAHKESLLYKINQSIKRNPETEEIMSKAKNDVESELAELYKQREEMEKQQ